MLLIVLHLTACSTVEKAVGIVAIPVFAPAFAVAMIAQYQENKPMTLKEKQAYEESRARFYQQEQTRFEKMMSEGDPDGYYFSAIMFARNGDKQSGSQYLTEIQDHYKQAINEGSNDAKYVLGTMLVKGDPLPFSSSFFDTNSLVLPTESRDIPKGLRLMEDAATKSCYYKQPFFANPNCNNVMLVNTASPLWYIYRDGLTARAQQEGKWIRLVEKNEAMAQKWKHRSEQCELEIKNYLNQCKLR